MEEPKPAESVKHSKVEAKALKVLRRQGGYMSVDQLLNTMGIRGRQNPPGPRIVEVIKALETLETQGLIERLEWRRVEERIIYHWRIVKPGRKREETADGKPCRSCKTKVEKPAAELEEWTPFRKRVYRLLEKQGPMQPWEMLRKLEIVAKVPETPFLALMSSLKALQRRGRVEMFLDGHRQYWRIPAHEDRIG